MSNFTKGEWKIFNERVGIIDKSDTQSYGMMMEVAYVDMYNFGGIEGKANAHLIASSPKMYKKLDEIASYLIEAGGIANTKKAREIENLLSEARGEHV